MHLRGSEGERTGASVLEHKKNMKQRLQQVRIEDFNIAALRKAAREGRLYIEPAAECETNIEHEVLDYVSRIEPYAAPEYRECIQEVWRRIVKHPLLAPKIKKGDEPFNKYVVTAIAIFLHESKVYTFATATAMHLQLEGISTRNKYYKNATYYAPSGKEGGALRAILHDLKAQNTLSENVSI